MTRSGTRGLPCSRSGRSQPWSFDVWSLGAMMLELCHGAPLWLSYKCHVQGPNGRDRVTTGLFAVPGRRADKILERQHTLLGPAFVDTLRDGALAIRLDDDGLDFLAGLLTWDPQHRMSPEEALSHPFLNAM